MTIAFASPYRENSILSIAAAASRSGQLDRFYTTIYAAGWSRQAARFPAIGQRLARELGRRAFPSIPGEKVESVAATAELIRIASFRLSTGLLDNPVGVMYWVKDRFDRSVARRLARRPPAAVVGMWASSMKTFDAAGPGCLKVLNYINSRPRAVNEYLVRYAGLPPGSPEMIPAAVERTVEREMELADVILVPSRFVADQMPEYSAKVLVQPYGVDLRHFSPGPPDPRFRCNVLVVGQIAWRKGFTTLLEAARRLPHLSFRAVGPLVAPALIKDLPQNVRYSGYVLHGELSAVMRSADCFVVASFEDAYPLVTLEAMASGTPVIVSDHAGTSEVVRPAVNGFVFPAGDVETLVGYISRIAGDPAMRENMSSAARDVVSTSYSWEQYSAAVLEILAHRAGRIAGNAAPAPGPQASNQA